jgi:hypothetical protein
LREIPAALAGVMRIDRCMRQKLVGEVERQRRP